MSAVRWGCHDKLDFNCHMLLFFSRCFRILFAVCFGLRKKKQKLEYMLSNGKCYHIHKEPMKNIIFCRLWPRGNPVQTCNLAVVPCHPTFFSIKAETITVKKFTRLNHVITFHETPFGVHFKNPFIRRQAVHFCLLFASKEKRTHWKLINGAKTNQ